MNDLHTVSYLLLSTWSHLAADLEMLFWFIPLVVIYELPLGLIVVSGLAKYVLGRNRLPQRTAYAPKVSVVVTCYSEGDRVAGTLLSMAEQIYPGEIEIIAVIDGAVQNADTYAAAKRVSQTVHRANRTIKLLPKWQRGGRVSTLNAGLAVATGEILVNADADTSFDCDAIDKIVRPFRDPNVPAVGGSLRVRNVDESVLTRMQGLEYLVSVQGGKTGLGQWNVLNNISGAYGAFRRDLLSHIGGWDTHTAEDLDLTIRLKQYFGRHPEWRIPFEPESEGYTDVPVTVRELLSQRLRWDGDLLFVYLRKHWPAFSPKLMGWKNLLFVLFYGLLQNVLMPVVVLCFFVWILLQYPWQIAVTVYVSTYLLYFAVVAFLYALVLIAVSRDLARDLQLAVWLPLYPLYSFFLRVVTVFAVLNELLRRSHEESSMAPWWVLKGGRRF